ncbi:unnamed protein product [Caenorhabditis bovis]|uniref:C-type lectin domain-containing protein n=1 Tax=Caenorhabditis bovis TaxID=2654633 RepID=A0A8S1EBV5_9PELO|nr:unnamed protein product [Caenorhabditis bovis]
MYSEDRLCESGWTRFVRTIGPVCIKVFTVDKPIIFDQAKSFCELEGALLGGIENEQEHTFVRDEAAVQNAVISNYRNGVWLAGVRLDSCRGSDWASKPGCREQSFKWTDPYVTGINGFYFYPERPDGVMISGVQQNCLVMYTTINEIAYHGLMDDHFCDAYCPDVDVQCGINMISYICVKTAG